MSLPPYHAGMSLPDSLQFVGRNEVRLGRRTLTYFSGCDYLRLARHPRLAAAARDSLERVGLNVSASRRTTGNHRIYGELEAALATFFGAEAAVLVPDGYVAALAAAQALAGQFTHAFVDELAHGALHDAAGRLAIPVLAFKHRDVDSLAAIVAQAGRRARPLVLTDGLFGHDGSVAPLRAYLQALPPSARLLVDDAHGVGILGASGQGTLEHEGIGRERIIQCGTLSKAFGAYGGVVLGDQRLREAILERSRLFAGTTPLPPPLAGAALAALKLVQGQPARRQRLRANAVYLRRELQKAGWAVADASGPIVRLPSLPEMQSASLKSRLLQAGIYPPYLKYGAASAAGYFRFVIASEHTRAQLDQVAAVLRAFNARS